MLSKINILGTAALLGVILCGHAVAGTVNLNGSGQMYWGAGFLGSSGGNTSTPPPDSNHGNTFGLSVPGQYTFTNQFTGPQSSTLTGVSSSIGNGTYSFQDTYEFSLSTPAQGDVLTVSLQLQGPLSSSFNISNLQFRLYEVPSSSTTPGLTVPTGSTMLTPWVGVAGDDNGTAIQANFTNAQSGTYFLDMAAGTADGGSGGTYIGQLNLAPVPLPASAWLLLSGVGGLGLLARSRR